MEVTERVFDTIAYIKYEISIEGKGIVEGGRLREQVPVGKKTLNVRKAYAPNNDVYKTGWVYDFDVSYCMICISEFGWFSRRHHCRGCGYVVCAECSPYKAKIAGLPEESESRVCKNCYTGNTLAPGSRFSPNPSFNTSFDLGQATATTTMLTASTQENICISPIENDIQRNKRKSVEKRIMDDDEFERSQERLYVMAYRFFRLAYMKL